jgi:hypothetical protein
MKLVVLKERSRVIEIVSRMIINSRRGRYGTYAIQEKKKSRIKSHPFIPRATESEF